MKRMLLIPALLLALLGAAMYWSKAPAEEKADFTFILHGEIGTLDPNHMDYNIDIRIGYALWEGLYTPDPVTLDAIPGCADPVPKEVVDAMTAGLIEFGSDPAQAHDLARRELAISRPDAAWVQTSIESVRQLKGPDPVGDLRSRIRKYTGANPTVYTFYILPEAKWSNGDDLVAQDFIFAWRRMLQSVGEYSSLFYYIKGAKEYSEEYQDEATWASADFSKVGIEALDRKTLRVTLKQYVAPFPDICAMPAYFPQHEKSMEPFLEQDVLSQTHGHIRAYNEAFTRPPNLVTNGPYVISAWDFKRRLRLTANPNYWDPASVKSKIIDQVCADDLQWAYARYTAGQADWVPDFNDEIGAAYYATHASDMHVFPSFGTYYYSFNCNPKFNNGDPNPFANIKVRQAFCHAVNKKPIVDTITRMGEIPCTTFIPVGAFTGYQSPPGLDYDVATARKLLAEAGYPGGKGFPAVTLLFNNQSVHGPIAEKIRRQWLEELGIDVTLKGIELNEFRQCQSKHDFAICRSGWYGDYNDPSTFTDTYKPDSVNNFSAWKNDHFVELCAKAGVERDPQKRLTDYQEAEDLLLTEAPILPLYTYVNQYLYHENVTGIPLNARMMVMLKSVKVKR